LLTHTLLASSAGVEHVFSSVAQSKLCNQLATDKASKLVLFSCCIWLHL